MCLGSRQRVAVSNNTRCRNVADKSQHVAQRCRRRRWCHKEATLDHQHAANRQVIHTISCGDCEVARCRERARAGIGTSKQVILINHSIAAASSRCQIADQHRIVRARQRDGQRRQIGIAIAIGQGIVKGILQDRARHKRINRGLTHSVQRVGLRAINIECKIAIGAGERREHPAVSAIRTRRIIGVNVKACRYRPAFSQPSAIVARGWHIINDINGDRAANHVPICVSRGVGEHVTAQLGVGAIISRRAVNGRRQRVAITAIGVQRQRAVSPRTAAQKRIANSTCNRECAAAGFRRRTRVAANHV